MPVTRSPASTSTMSSTATTSTRTLPRSSGCSTTASAHRAAPGRSCGFGRARTAPAARRQARDGGGSSSVTPKIGSSPSPVRSCAAARARSTRTKPDSTRSLSRMFPVAREAAAAPPPETSLLLPDDDRLLEVALAAKNGDKLRRLLAGDVSMFDGDESRADAALAALRLSWRRRPGADRPDRSRFQPVPAEVGRAAQRHRRAARSRSRMRSRWCGSGSTGSRFRGVGNVSRLPRRKPIPASRSPGSRSCLTPPRRSSAASSSWAKRATLRSRSG